MAVRILIFCLLQFLASQGVLAYGKKFDCDSIFFVNHFGKNIGVPARYDILPGIGVDAGIYLSLTSPLLDGPTTCAQSGHMLFGDFDIFKALDMYQRNWGHIEGTKLGDMIFKKRTFKIVPSAEVEIVERLYVKGTKFLLVKDTDESYLEYLDSLILKEP